MSKLMRNEDAFTGLEAAIVLIAFIVVAAVFSYVMLGAGFFATGEAQRVVDTGVAQASSAVELSGPVIVNATDGKVHDVRFFLQLAAGGAPVDMQKVIFTVSTANNVTTYQYANVSSTWYMDGINKTTDMDELLERFETVEIVIPGNLTNDPELPEIKPNDRFTVEVKPDVGARLPINRIAPPDLKADHKYEVY